MFVMFPSMSLKHLKPQSNTINPTTHNTFRHCRVRFLLDNLSRNSCIPGDMDLAVSNIERCVLEIDHLMLVNRLKLNRKDKTELLVISAKYLQVPINNYWMRLTMIS